MSVDNNKPLPETLRVNNGTLPPCLSELPHPASAVTDVLQHYLGCVEIQERRHFLDPGHPFWLERVDGELERLESRERTRAGPSKGPRWAREKEAGARIQRAITDLAIAINEYHQRTRVLRNAVGVPLDTSRATYDNIVLYVEQSRQLWRASSEYREGIEKVRRWRSLRRLCSDDNESVREDDSREDPGWLAARAIISEFRGDVEEAEEIRDYNLEEDVSAYIIQYTRVPSRTPGHHSGFQQPRLRPYEEDTREDRRFRGRFPHQHVSMSALLESHSRLDHGQGVRDILSKKDYDAICPQRLRYIHIPSNNMQVG